MKYDQVVWREHFIQFEGLSRSFYLDGTDNVTIGIGCLITEPSTLPLLLKSTGGRASQEDVRADFNAVKALPPGRIPAYYDRVCRTRMLEADIFNLFENRLGAFIQRIEDCITVLEGFPDVACLVLVDMAFNLGVDGLMRKFPKFMNAFLAHDWKVAALECKREGIQQDRNDWARTTLETLIQFQK
jgi:GH24 family phage-related lysozyme (muramidase)